jgi:hypothetical protein
MGYSNIYIWQYGAITNFPYKDMIVIWKYYLCNKHFWQIVLIANKKCENRLG